MSSTHIGVQWETAYGRPRRVKAARSLHGFIRTVVPLGSAFLRRGNRLRNLNGGTVNARQRTGRANNFCRVLVRRNNFGIRRFSVYGTRICRTHRRSFVSRRRTVIHQNFRTVITVRSGRGSRFVGGEHLGSILIIRKHRSRVLIIREHRSLIRGKHRSGRIVSSGRMHISGVKHTGSIEVFGALPTGVFRTRCICRCFLLHNPLYLLALMSVSDTRARRCQPLKTVAPKLPFYAKHRPSSRANNYLLSQVKL